MKPKPKPLSTDEVNQWCDLTERVLQAHRKHARTVRREKGKKR